MVCLMEVCSVVVLLCTLKLYPLYMLYSIQQEKSDWNYIGF